MCQKKEIFCATPLRQNSVIFALTVTPINNIIIQTPQHLCTASDMPQE